MEEENIAYDHGPVQVKGTRRRKAANDKAQEADHGAHMDKDLHHALRISGTETLGGMYALLLTSLGIAFPVSQYTSSSTDARMRDNFDTGFALYVYIISMVFQIYITVAVRFHKYFKKNKHEVHRHSTHTATEVETEFGGTHQRKKTGSKGEIYVIDDVEKKDGGGSMHGGPDLPWHQWYKLAPAIYESKYGFNLFTRIGVLLFGMSAVALDICRLIEYSRHPNGRCYTNALKTLAIIRIIFFILQSFFLFIHHKVVFNFHHPLIKIGLLHLLSANLIAWINMIAVTAIDVVALYELGDEKGLTPGSHTTVAPQHGGHPPIATHSNYTINITSTHDTSSLAYRHCLEMEGGNLAFLVGRYLGPLVIGYFVLAAGLIYRMYRTVGPEIYLTPQTTEVWETSADTGRIKCGQPNWGFVLGLPLFLVTLGISCWHIHMDSWKMDRRFLKTLGRIHTGCDLFWNVATLVALVPSFYLTHKLKYLRSYPMGTPERMLISALGGTYILLGFMSVAALMYIDHPVHGGSAKMAVPGCIMNFVQSSAMFVFTVDAWRRRLHTADNIPGKDAITFLIWANCSMWLVTSFQWKTAFGSYLFMVRFGILPWVLIINSTLPLAMFFRFLTCVLLADVLRVTYGTHVRRRLNLCS